MNDFTTKAGVLRYLITVYLELMTCKQEDERFSVSFLRFRLSEMKAKPLPSRCLVPLRKYLKGNEQDIELIVPMLETLIDILEKA
jgi:hypothetical protein